MALNQAVVLDAAITLLDEVGLDELTTRRLAGRLGVRVGALYWHYASKRALLDAIAERLAGEAAEVPLPEGDWTVRVPAFARAHRDAMLAHSDGARIIATMSAPGPMARGFIERPIAALIAAGMTRTAAADAADVITSYVNGFATEEQARKTQQSRECRDNGFDRGLAVIIAGLRTLV